MNNISAVIINAKKNVTSAIKIIMPVTAVLSTIESAARAVIIVPTAPTSRHARYLRKHLYTWLHEPHEFKRALIIT